MENRAMKVLNEKWAWQDPLTKPETINYEWATNKQQVMVTITQALFKAAAVMGISLDAEKAAFTTKEAVIQIGKQYPFAYIVDIVMAIEMASFGEIKLDNQLTTISAYNIYQWYAEFRKNHIHKSPRSMYSSYEKPKAELTDGSEHNKKQVMLDSFTSFLEKPIDMMVSVYFDTMLKISAIPQNLYDSRTEMYKMEAEHIVKNFPHTLPIDLITQKATRQNVYHYRDVLLAHLNENEPLDFQKYGENPLHKHIVYLCKKQLVQEAIKRLGKEEILSMYKKHYEIQ
jgi:hypothetical protein